MYENVPECYCGYKFLESDGFSMSQEELYYHSQEGTLLTIAEAPDGAIWEVPWKQNKGLDGISVGIKCPGGDIFYPEDRAANCTKPFDHEHLCWVRIGDLPEISIGKQWKSCRAGASIHTPNYHGFLTRGKFS